MKVKIIRLFEAYKSQVNETPNVADVFSKSGMVNRIKELNYGFFPLGSGILTKKCKVEEAEIEDRGIMVLGNDFGTCQYLKDKCINHRENNSKTINNLETIGLEIEKTFFTNFFLGLRIRGTMTKRIDPLEHAYKAFCHKFFLTQLNTINPSIVICLGNDVRFVLYDFFKDQFPTFKSKKITYRNLYETVDDKKYEVTTKKNSELGGRKFVFIPHPSYAHINWTPDIRTKIELAVKTRQSIG